MTSLPRAVSFDLDGTLYDQRRAAWRALLTMPHRLGFLRTWQRVRRDLRHQLFDDGEALRQAELRALSSALHLEVPRAERQLAKIAAELNRAIGRAGPFAASRPLILALRCHGIPVAVLSDLPVDAKLAALKLADLDWAVCLDAGSTGALKPHPRSFHHVAAAMGVPVTDVWHVGDRHDTDVDGILRVGGHAVWLKAKPKRPAVAGTLVVASLEQLASHWGLTLT